MKNTIKYYYNFDNINLIRSNESMYIKYKQEIYVFCRIINKDETLEIYSLTRNMPNFYQFIINKDNSIFTPYQNNLCVLLKVTPKKNITFKANNIVTFFKDYILYNGSVGIEMTNSLTPFIYIAIFLIIIMSITIYYLMKYKKKPKLFYIITIVVSLLSLLLFINLTNNIRVLETTVLPAKEIRLLRDISRVNYWMLLIITIPVLIRGLGFDIKKFNFNKDLQDLKLEAEDNEEVEVTTNISSDKILNTGRKQVRELKYYYTEYKLFINIILGIIAIILILAFPFNKFVIHGTIGEKQTLVTDNFNLKVEESYISTRNRISRDNSYVIAKIKIKGKKNKYILRLDELVLKGKHNDYIPSLKYYNYFTDIGKGYNKQYLSLDNYTEYLLIYNIKNEDKNSKLIIHDIAVDKKIKLNPQELD